ncbi:hypothetical protein RYH80_17895 [Halobaculum sp. MBLA0147]|uniref:hypothetical protein n=1 Tax=Halobaculum sp. MBLA0147 TaxID=3079934 RepID=UPI00352677E7
MINVDPVDTHELFMETVEETCSCGTEVTDDYTVAEWPAIPLTAEAIVGFLQRMDGYVTLRVKSLRYPEETPDWESVLPLKDPDPTEQWDLALIQDRLVARTRYGHDPIWDLDEFTTDTLELLFRHLPSEPLPIWKSSLTGLARASRNGVDIDAGIPVDELSSLSL